MANPYQPPVAQSWAGAAVSSGSYEFSGTENEIIDKAGKRARLWGVFSFIIGGLSIVGAVVFLVASGSLVSLGGPQFGSLIATLVGGATVLLLLNGIVYAVMGKLYIDAGASLLSVVISEGNDVEHMLQSLKKLGLAFQVEGIMTLLAFVVGLAAGVIGVGANMAGG